MKAKETSQRFYSVYVQKYTTEDLFFGVHKSV